MKKERAQQQERKGANINVGRAVQEHFAAYCEKRKQIQGAIASCVLTWFMGQPKGVRDMISEPDEVMGSDAREAYCGMLKGMAAEVCGEKPNGLARRTFADTSAVPSAPADGPSSRHARAR